MPTGDFPQQPHMLPSIAAMNTAIEKFRESEAECMQCKRTASQYDIAGCGDTSRSGACPLAIQFCKQAEAEQKVKNALDRRERIATAALNGLLAGYCVSHPTIEMARMAVEQADALIASLDEAKP